MKVFLVDAVHCFIIENGGRFEIFREMFDLLESFPNRKILLTNAAKGDEYKKFGLDKVPYDVFTMEHDPEKANPEYYRNMLRHFNLRKNDVIYFEHNSNAVKNAESIGIKTYFYDQWKKDLEGLKSFLANNL